MRFSFGDPENASYAFGAIEGEAGSERVAEVIFAATCANDVTARDLAPRTPWRPDERFRDEGASMKVVP